LVNVRNTNFGSKSTAPTINTSVSTLTGFNYSYASGPSNEQSFSVGGTYLTANLIITPSTNYEISTGTGTSFSAQNTITLVKNATGNVASTIYVRLKAGLGAGSYNSEVITATSTGVTQKDITCNGIVSKISQTITFGTLSSVTYGSSTITFTGTTTSLLTLSYESSNTSVATVSGNTVTIVGAGSTNITASQAGNANFNASSNVVRTLVVNAKTLTITSPIATNKVYTGTNTAIISGTLTGIINSDDVTLNGTGTFTSVNVANGISVTSTSTLGGIKAVNYAITQPTGLTANITAKDLTITIINGVNKSYSGTNTATLAGTASYSGLVNNEIHTVTGSPVATFNDVNVGTAKAITITGYTAPNSNYTLTQPSLSANITAVGLTITGISGVNKIFDGNAMAFLSGTATYAGLVNDESFTVTDTPSANFADAVVGTSKAITVTGFTSPSANYTVSQPTGLTADITAVPISTVPITSNSNETAISGTTANVIVSGASTTLSITNNKTVNSVTVDPDAKLNFSTAKILSVTGDLIFKADTTKTFSANIGSGGISVTGVVKYLKTMNDKKWFFMSFPCSIKVGDIIRSDAGALVLNTDLFIKYYDGANRATHGIGGAVVNWIAITNPTDSLVAYKGYVFGLRDGLGVKELSFPLKNKIVASESKDRKIPVLENAGSLGTNHNGWNLVGQPYLSKYAGANATGVSFMTLTSDGLKNYTTYSKIIGGLPTLDPFGAYFLQVGAPDSIPFTLGGRQSAPSAITVNLSEVVQLNMTTDTGTDNTSLIMDNDQSAAYQIGQDMEKWIGTGTAKPQVYTVLDGINYAFNALPMTNVNNLPVGFYTQTSGSTTISVDAIKASSLSKLLLTDNGTNPATVTDLLVSNYTFTAAAGTNNTRFSISAQRITTDNNTMGNELGEICISIVNGKLLLANVANNTTVRLYDALGRMVSNKTVNGNYVGINLNTRGIYTVQFQNGSTISTRKVIF